MLKFILSFSSLGSEINLRKVKVEVCMCVRTCMFPLFYKCLHVCAVKITTVGYHHTPSMQDQKQKKKENGEHKRGKTQSVFTRALTFSTSKPVNPYLSPKYVKHISHSDFKFPPILGRYHRCYSWLY